MASSFLKKKAEERARIVDEGHGSSSYGGTSNLKTAPSTVTAKPASSVSVSAPAVASSFLKDKAGANTQSARQTFKPASATTKTTSATDRYSALRGNSDFKKFSSKGAAIKNQSFEDIEKTWELFGTDKREGKIENIVTYSRDNWEKIAAAEEDRQRVAGSSLYRYMKDEEVDIYNYLLAKNGKVEAQKYLDSIESTLGERHGEELGDKVGSAKGVGGALAKGSFSLGAGTDQWVSGVKQLTTEERLPTSPTQVASQAIQENMGTVGKTLYNVGTTVGNMLPSIILSNFGGALAGGVAGAAGATAATASKVAGTVGKVTSALTMGGASAGNTYNQAMATAEQEGYTKGQAKLYAGLVGASEAVLGSLLGGAGNITGLGEDVLLAKVAGMDKAFARLALSGAIRLAGEEIEEISQLWLEPALASLILKRDFEAPTWQEHVETAIVTALSTGLMEAPSVAGVEIDYNRFGEMVLENHSENAVIGEALANAKKGSAAHRLALQLEDQIEQGKKPSASDIGRLHTLTQSEINPVVAEPTTEPTTETDTTTDTTTAAPDRTTEKKAPFATKAETDRLLNQTKSEDKATADYATAQLAHEGETVVSPIAQTLMDKGMKPADAVEQAALIMKVQSGQKLTKSENAKLNLAHESVRTAFTEATGVEVTDGQARNASQRRKVIHSAEELAALKAKNEAAAKAQETAAATAQAEVEAVQQVEQQQAQAARRAQAETMAATMLEEAISREAEGTIEYEDGSTQTQAEFVEAYRAQFPRATEEEAIATFQQYKQFNAMGQKVPGEALTTTPAKDNNVTSKKKGGKGKRSSVGEAETVTVDSEGRTEAGRAAERELTLKELNRIAGEHGITVEVRDPDGTTLSEKENGFYDHAEKKIILNAKKATNQFTMTYYFVHELTHGGQAVDGDVKAGLTSDIIGAMEKIYGKEAVDKLIADTRTRYENHFKSTGKDLSVLDTPNYIEDEVAADFMMKAISNRSLLDTLAGVTVKPHQALIRNVKSFLSGKKDADIGVKEAKRLIERMQTSLENAQKQGLKNLEDGSTIDPKKREVKRSVEDSTDYQGRQDSGRTGIERHRAGHSELDAGRRHSRRGDLGGTSKLLIPEQTRRIMNDKGIPDVGLTETDDRSAFSVALDAAKAANPNGGMVDSQSVEGLTESGARTFMRPDGNAGVAVEADGNIVGVFKNPALADRGAVTDLVLTAIAQGGNHLDCYATYGRNDLRHKYTALGFEPVAWLEFNREYAPDDWNYEAWGEPDVVMWVHNGDTAEQIVNRETPYRAWTKDDIHALPKFEDYDEAKAHQKAELEKRIASRTENKRFSIDDGEYAPTYYSQMERVVQGMKQTKFGASSVVSMLRGRGVKAEEIKWSGVEQWLEGKKSVTKDELLEFIAGSELQIEETVLDGREVPYTEEQDQQIAQLQSEVEGLRQQVFEEWERLTGEEYPAWTISNVMQEVMDYNASLKSRTDEGARAKNLQKEVLRLIEWYDYFGFDSAKQALSYFQRDPDDFIESTDWDNDSDKQVFIDYANAREARDEQTVGISREDTFKLLHLAEEARKRTDEIHKIRDRHYDEERELRPRWQDYTLDGGENYREYLFKLPDSNYSNAAMQSHWGNREGVLAHARLQDFNTETGKMLFIEEIQSDWHNAGHRDGYADKNYDVNKAIADVDRRRDELYQKINKEPNLVAVRDRLVPGIIETNRSFGQDINEDTAREYAGNMIMSSFYPDEVARRGNITLSLAEKQAIDDILEELRQLTLERIDARTKAEEMKRRAPEAPFSNTYHEYVLKRLLRMAAEEGYDSIGWTTAQQQVDRWSEDYAEGYRIEYDQDIPKFLNKYGKQWGAKVGQIALPGGSDQSTLSRDLENLDPYDEYDIRQMMQIYLEDADPDFGERNTDTDVKPSENGLSVTVRDIDTWEEWIMTSSALDRVKRSGGEQTVWSMPITDAMRQSVLYEGQPRYSIDPVTGYEQGSVEDKVLKLLKAGTTEDAISMLEQWVADIEAGKVDTDTVESSLKDAYFKAQPLTPQQRADNRKKLDDLVKKYGAIKPGAVQRDKNGNVVSHQVIMPNRVRDTKGVSDFARTLAEDKKTPEWFRDEIERAIADEMSGYTYDIATDKAAMQYVSGRKQVSFEHNLRLWENVVELGNTRLGTGGITKNDIALGEYLYTEAVKAGDVDLATKLAAELATVGTAAGQVVQAMSLLKKMTPSGKLYYLSRTIERLNNQYQKKIDAGKMSKIKYDKDLAAAVLNAKTAEEAQDAMTALLQDVANQIPPTLAERWNAWRYLSMLGNPRTHIRNILSNVVFAPVTWLKDMVDATLFQPFVRRENRTKHLGEALSSAIYGLTFTGVKLDKYVRFADADYKTMKDVLSGGGKYNPADLIREMRPVFKAKAMDAVAKGNSKALDAEDKLFLREHYVRALSQYLAAQKADVASLSSTPEGRNQLAKARAWAVQEAKKATFRDASALANALSRLERSGVAGQIIVGGVMPFKKTPINILKRGVEYSPLGVVQTVKEMTKGKENAAKTLDSLASTLTGTGIIALGLYLAKEGLLRASGDDDEKEREFEELQGAQSYSLTLDDGTSYTIDWMAPAALPLFIGAKVHEVFSENGELSYSDYADVLMLIAEPMFQLSMLDGLNSTLTAAGYSDNPVSAVAASMLTGYFGQAIPTLLGQVARTVDDTRRATYIDKNKDTIDTLDRTVQYNMTKVPGASKMLAPKLDAWGRSDTESNAWLRAFENFISPGYVSNMKTSAMEEELERLYEMTGKSSVLPKSVSKYFTVDKVRRDLTADEWATYQTEAGQGAYEMLTRLVNSAAYKSLSDAQRAKAVEDVFTYADEKAKEAAVSDYATDTAWIAKADKLESSGLSVEDYIVQSVLSDETSGQNTKDVLGMEWLGDEDKAMLVSAAYAKGIVDDNTFTDPNRTGYEYTMTATQVKQYEEHFEELWMSEYKKLISGRKYTMANLDERADMVDALKSDVAADTKKWMARNLRQEGTRSTKKD